MSFLRGSANYVWCTTSVLGKGATGAVFQGVNKHTGEAVAVKSFNQLSHMRPEEVQLREFEVLQKVKHDNIVKLLAIEDEQEGRGRVIVMELCTGGSLFNLLDDPENSYGLAEDDWILVLSHLSAGMNHLRDHNLVHRDLKPGNIMKFIKDDGTIVYKLTDFGAARELEDDQQFVSLYGTEEYLHPDMYERAVLRKPVGKTFGATVDLWSIGVTLYHVATGNLPFRPFGGRRNKETMFHITTNKSSGVISGVQNTDNGPIQWNRELPITCHLSTGIKRLVTPLLAGLLEVNSIKRWTFERFFSHVTAILKRKKIYIYFVNKETEHRIYLDKNENFSDFKDQLCEQTGVQSQDMLLLYHEKELLGFNEENECPNSTLDTPIILWNKENNGISLGVDMEVPSFPTIPNLLSVENDATLAKSACSIGFAHKRKIECFTRILSNTELAVKELFVILNVRLENLLQVSLTIQSSTQYLDAQISFFTSTHELHIKNSPRLFSDGSILRDSLNSIVVSSNSQFKTLQIQFQELFPAIEQLYKKYAKENQLKKEWRDVKKDIPPNMEANAKKANSSVIKLKESWQHLLRDRASRTLSYNDEQFHILEKIKMQETIRTLADILNKDVKPILLNSTEILADWYKMAQTTFLQTEILSKDMRGYEKRLQDFTTTLKESQDNYSSSLESAFLSASNELISSPLESSNNGEESRLLKKAVKSILTTQDEVWNILRENNRLIKQFGQLVSESNLENNTSADIIAQLEQLSTTNVF